jgi:uncharacterized protein (TIGR03032 family)
VVDRHHEAALRDPEQVISLSTTTTPFDPAALDARFDDGFVQTLEELGVTLLVTREYEHLVVALGARDGALTTSCLRVPHPSGLVVDRTRDVVHVACTRNPNQLLELRPAAGWFDRSDRFGDVDPGGGGLVPSRLRYLPGCMYLHDLALVGDRLVANAVGMNAVVDVTDETSRAVWWPRSMDAGGRVRGTRNLIQLNSISAGATLETSMFTASCEAFNGFHPGDLAWPVDRQGVLFDGNTGEVCARGLTRPHSARPGPDGSVWVDDSGYGTLNLVVGENTEVVSALGGWTRGLCVIGGRAIVGTSRIIPRYEAYAPGVDPADASCGLHIVDLATGEIEGTLTWPAGDQVFAIDWMSAARASGFVGGWPSPNGATDAAWYKFRPAGDEIAGLTVEEG